MESNNLKSWISAHDATKPPARPVPRAVSSQSVPPVPAPAPVTSVAAPAATQPQPRVARKLPKPAMPKLSRSTQLTVLAAVAGLVLVVGGTLLAGRFRRPQPGGSPGSGSAAETAQSGLPHDKPSFSLVYPAGKSAASLEIVRISPDGRDPVYAFYDKLQGQTILISQQKLPSQFKSAEASELERTAKEFQATSVIQIDGQKVYHGLSDRSKTQSLIFIKKDLLVLIKSPEKLSDTDWVGYIGGLR